MPPHPRGGRFAGLRSSHIGQYRLQGKPFNALQLPLKGNGSPSAYWMLVLGIDLAGSARRPSGYALMTLRLEVMEAGHLYGDEEILGYASKTRPSLISIDAPLTLARGFRRCERLMIEAGYRLLPASSGPMRMLAERGSRLAAELRKRGLEVVETHPASSLRALGYKGRITRLGAIRFLASELGLAVRNDLSKHEVDAILSALAGVCHLAGVARRFEAEDGAIVIATRGVLGLRRP